MTVAKPKPCKKRNREAANRHDKKYRDSMSADEKAARSKRAREWLESKPEKKKAYSAMRRSRWQKFLAEKKNHPCTDCGRRFPKECMDFDHKRDKRFGISTGMGRPVKEVLAEIKKCDLVCSNCHRIRTSKRMRAKK